ncbi:hypothetical protein SAMN05446037_100284 [Anaerovirgula multivorans]|uniref:Uncharacterized protein n=1 Tax=Anaerovirgula multivorans TaxID=312168 RepID=A0A239AJA9_9FIRM|nr:hypothetical protein [Anaerovirgula multivorans]SNR95745.1 hypothetical protein SAMN05446037_100284 [Anaerovirgula multivorans]
MDTQEIQERFGMSGIEITEEEARQTLKTLEKLAEDYKILTSDVCEVLNKLINALRTFFKSNTLEELNKLLLEFQERPKAIHDTPYRPKVIFRILCNKPRICCIRNRL